MLEAYGSDAAWIVVLGFFIALLLAFGVGANDVANSFGTSVGSKVLTLRQACILATIFEMLGALLMGFKVSDTVRKDIFDVDMYEGEEKILMMGNMAALLGSGVWNLAATFLKLPISGTHSIVGAMLGFTFVAKGFRGIHWKTLGFIVASWFLSPLLSGLISALFFVVVQKLILNKERSTDISLTFLPVFYGVTIFVNAFSVIHDGSPVLAFDRIPWWGAVVASVVLACVVAAIIRIYLIPKYKREFEKDIPMQGKISLENPDGEASETGVEDDTPETAKIFKGLQIMTAVFGSFAHGGNDVSNAIAPLISLWLIYSKNPTGSTPVWLLLYGGLGISAGLWTMGRKVIQTMGQDLTKITPSSGFTIEMGSATTVLLASKLGLPISTTHCKVGSVVSVGCVRSASTKGVDLKLFRSIIMAWLVTLPFTALLSAATMLVLYSVTV